MWEISTKSDSYIAITKENENVFFYIRSNSETPNSVLTSTAKEVVNILNGTKCFRKLKLKGKLYSELYSFSNNCLLGCASEVKKINQESGKETTVPERVEALENLVKKFEWVEWRKN